MDIIRKAFPLHTEVDEAQRGTFRGIAVIYGERAIDNGDTIKPGAFKKSLQERGNQMPMLWSHDVSQPLGPITVIRDDSRSLEVEGRLLVDAVPRAGEIYELLRHGVVRGLSVAFLPVRFDQQKDGSFVYNEAKLFEVSLVSIPAFQNSQVAEVRSVATNLDAEIVRAFSAFDARKCKFQMRLGTRR